MHYVWFKHQKQNYCAKAGLHFAVHHNARGLQDDRLKNNKLFHCLILVSVGTHSGDTTAPLDTIVFK